MSPTIRPSSRLTRPLAVLTLGALGILLVQSASPAPASASSRRPVLDAQTLRAVLEGMRPRAPVPSGPAGTQRYIIQLADAPLAAYEGGLAGLPATAAPGETQRLTTDSGAARAYSRYLESRQAQLEARLARLAPSARVTQHYRVAFNGLTARLTPQQAARVALLPGVVSVTPEEAVVPLMDASLDRIAAPTAWNDARVGGRSEAGRGVRVAILDTGITATHPMFDDAGFVAPAGFPKSTLTVGDRVYNYSPQQVAQFTNNKVIAARAYGNPEVITQTNPADVITPLAQSFHGAHVAGIAAGSVVSAGPRPAASGSLTLSGVAPGAQLMSYRFDYAYTPEILKMIDDAVADGAGVINNSWGSSSMNLLDPRRHPISQAFQAATRAGVVVVAAGGNSGLNGEATLGGPHQMIDEVITVGNVETGRTFTWTLRATDDGLPDELRAHRATLWDTGATFDVIEGQAFTGDLCNPVAALGARGRLALAPVDRECDPSLIPFPGLGFLQQLITAGVVGARAVVLYAPDGEPWAFPIGLDDLFRLLGQNVELPPTAMIAGSQAMQLVDWANSHASLRLILDGRPERHIDASRIDQPEMSTSQGPAPGSSAGVKPDLSAPGTDILSASTSLFDGSPRGYVTATGTSMASPHVAGAAAVVRQAYPRWTPQEIKSALVITADPITDTISGARAPVRLQGAGRLNLARALDPGVLVMPPSLELGNRSSGQLAHRLEVHDVRSAPQTALALQVTHEAGLGAGAMEPRLTASVVIPAGGSGFVDVVFELDSLPLSEYDGWIRLEGQGYVVRIAYHLRVVGQTKDVLLVNVRTTDDGFSDTPDYNSYWTASLREAGLSHDIWTVSQEELDYDEAPPYSVLRNYRLVIVAAGDGNAPLDTLFAGNGMTSIQMYLLSGGRVLSSGWNWNHTGVPTQIQSHGAMYFLSRYFAGFDRLQDDVTPSGDLTPVRLFDRPVSLSTTASVEAAANGDRLDLGQPLRELTTRSPDPLTPALDQGIAAPLVVERIMPYMRSYLELGGLSAMTGVTPDATLENPVHSLDIPWRALFAGFGLEAVQPAAGRMSRAQMLGRIFEWAVEPDDFRLTLDGPDSGHTGAGIDFVATATSASGVRAVGWRWDAGDERGYFGTAGPQAAIGYHRPGTYTVRVEALTEAGHTYVAQHVVTVTGQYTIFLPVADDNAARRSARAR